MSIISDDKKKKQKLWEMCIARTLNMPTEYKDSSMVKKKQEEQKPNQTIRSKWNWIDWMNKWMNEWWKI